MIRHPGSQLWSDVRWRGGWRIQSHFRSSSSRLLDPHDRVEYQGSLPACERALERIGVQERAIDHLVVILHGLGRTRYSMRRIDRALTDAGLCTARLDYPSTRRGIAAHAQTVAGVLDTMPTPTRLSFVTHSLGGLIVRKMLEATAPWRESVHRVVMLAPPNQGAVLARTLDNPVLRTVMGPSFVELVEGITESLAVPDVPISIFAGRVGNTDTDGLVKIEETKLETMSEHHVVPSVHTFVMNHPAAIAGSVSFLRAPPNVR
jgi:pimeloyl-ACP methyl ester carboxylesterase